MQGICPSMPICCQYGMNLGRWQTSGNVLLRTMPRPLHPLHVGLWAHLRRQELHTLYQERS